MIRKEPDALKQNEFDAMYLDRPNILHDLSTLSSTLIALEKALPKAPPETLKAQLEKLDLRLLRYACTHLRIRLVDAAMVDGAELLVRATVNGPAFGSGDEPWADWLGDAPCWPALLKDHWKEARELAWIKLKAHLETQGIALDYPAEQELAKAVVRLSMEDALGEGLMARFYPKEEEGGEAGEGKGGGDGKGAAEFDW